MCYPVSLNKCVCVCLCVLCMHTMPIVLKSYYTYINCWCFSNLPLSVHYIDDNSRVKMSVHGSLFDDYINASNMPVCIPHCVKDSAHSSKLVDFLYLYCVFATEEHC